MSFLCLYGLPVSLCLSQWVILFSSVSISHLFWLLSPFPPGLSLHLNQGDKQAVWKPSADPEASFNRGLRHSGQRSLRYTSGLNLKGAREDPPRQHGGCRLLVDPLKVKILLGSDSS